MRTDIENKATTTKRNGLFGRAVDLLRRRTVFHPDEVADIIAAAESIERAGRPDSYDELELVQVGRRLRAVRDGRPRPPREPSPLDDAVLVAEQRLAAEEAAWQRARDAVDAAREAGRAVERMRPREDAPHREQARWLAQRDDALSAYAAAVRELEESDRRLLRARSRLNALLLRRDAWRADRATAYHGCRCSWCRGEPRGDVRPEDCIAVRGY